MCAMSYFDIGGSVAQPSQSEVAQAAQDTLPLQSQPTGLSKGLAVRPRLNLSSTIQAAGVRQRAQADIGLGERRLGLDQQQLAQGERKLGFESRRADMGIQQTDYNASMVPYQIALGGLAGAQGFYRGYQDLRKGQETEDMLRQNMAMREQMGREVVADTRARVSLAEAVRALWMRQGVTTPMALPQDIY